MEISAVKSDLQSDPACRSIDNRNRYLYLPGSVKLLLFVVTFLLLSGYFHPLWANVFSSAHDLYSQGYLIIPENQARSSHQCTLCHPVHDRVGPRVWDMLPESLEGLGAAGNLCASCHDGVSIVDKNVDASLTVFHPDSHGSDMEQAPPRTNVRYTGLPSDDLRCINCHDPHNETNRPFLRIPITGLCGKCHKERGHTGYGILNSAGNHPVDIEPFDDTEGPSPIELSDPFKIPFPAPYPARDGMLSKEGHWILGGHLTYGNFGKIECTTCHAFHGLEGAGPVDDLLSRDPVNEIANEFCEGCHRGERGDDNQKPPFPNPGGTSTGRTYHPADDDEANGIGGSVAIADTNDRSYYQWGKIDDETERPIILCTTCHVAHSGMENSPALVPIDDESKNDGVETFCQICHRDPPPGHHGYADDGTVSPEIAQQIARNEDSLGHTYGEPYFDKVYCSHCHRAHNAGYNRVEESFIPILVDTLTDICVNCHSLGVSHFVGDPTLPSTYDKADPPLFRWTWPVTLLESSYDGDEEIPMTITCLSCHYLTSPGEGGEDIPSRLLAPADENSVWTSETPEDYLCTGCHLLDVESFGEGHTHPTMNADRSAFPTIYTDHILPDELAATYTEEDLVNCHSCHSTHNAAVRGGVYILKIVGGDNLDPKAIHPKIDFTTLCHSCHPSDEY